MQETLPPCAPKLDSISVLMFRNVFLVVSVSILEFTADIIQIQEVLAIICDYNLGEKLFSS